MTTIEHLNKIKAKCVELISKYPPCESTAGWRSTIALINMLFSLPSWVIPEVDHPETVSALLSAWPEELLN